MTTGRLFLGAIGRGLGWGTLGGVGAGALFGFLIPLLIGVVGLVGANSARYSEGELVSAANNFTAFGMIGMCVGGLIGLPVGIGMGVIGGLVLALVTRVFFMPLQATAVGRYRRVMGAVGAGFGALGGAIPLVQTLGGEGEPGFKLAMLGLIALAILIGAPLGWFVGAQVARWYARASAPEALPADATETGPKLVAQA